MVKKTNSQSKIINQSLTFKGKQIKLILYVGKNLGHGNYIAAVDAKTNSIIRNSQNVPIPFHKMSSFQ